MEPSAKKTAVAGRKIVQTRVYYYPSTGEAVHVHRLAAHNHETGDEKHLSAAVDLFDKWIRAKYGEELAYIVVAEDDLDRDGPLRVDPASRALSFG